MDRTSASARGMIGGRIGRNRQVDGLAGRFRFDFAGRPHDRGGVPADFSDRMLLDLAPRGLVEEVLVDRIIAASWVLRRADEEGCFGGNEAKRAERSLRTCLAALQSARGAACRPGTPALSAHGDGESLLRDDQPEPQDWRARLTLDPAVSPDSPVVRGTWITVRQVISRIIDGWTWDDLLRAHPELCTDDIRACLAFAVEDEEAR